ncbi:hypothetical protein [Halomicrobium mukohataei]|uniref:Uncharacterized protein n=1 Tax=Halomicrobium mukohataei (strain ATCC 700874 / DSM 12286 / JCM 9738 / NCIMB 13541) TaxID=485914 RepID=C7NYF6_HALMD|nr:hypothetical protein [Halomicrobium mukohataei]ACV46617.1 conserved hypothetical protein [Halomicrobium mukohataei DSM 12286]
MTRTQITLYGDDSDRFDAMQEAMAENQPGSKPGNAEAVRRLMDMASF